jgi:hypothetical protein
MVQRQSRRIGLPPELESMSESMAKYAAPWRRFLGQPPRGVKWKKLDLRNALALVHDAFEKKIREDINDDARGETRQSFADYVRDYALQRFGLPSLAEGTIFALVEATRRFAAKSTRLRRFGRMTGILEPLRYSPRYASVALAIMRELFQGRKLAALLRSRREGLCFVPLSHVVPVLHRLFCDTHVSVTQELLRTADHRRRELIAQVTACAKPLRSAIQDALELAGQPGVSVVGKGSEERLPRALAGDMTPIESVVDLDVVLDLAMATWEQQMERDRQLLTDMYAMYDVDNNGVLTFDEFTTVIRACVDPRDPAAERLLREKSLLQIFKEVVAMDPREASSAGDVAPRTGSPGNRTADDDDYDDDTDVAASEVVDDLDLSLDAEEAGADEGPLEVGRSDGQNSNALDAVSLTAFVRMFEEHGLHPYRETGAPPPGAGSASPVLQDEEDAALGATASPEGRVRSGSLYRNKAVIGVGMSAGERDRLANVKTGSRVRQPSFLRQKSVPKSKQ